MLLLLSDKMTMATSIECRVPLLDRGLVELAARIPAEHKLEGGALKHIFKRAVADTLPDEIVNRRKRGFGAPMGTWLSGELEPLRSTLLGEDGLAGRDILDGKVLGAICRAHDQRREDFSDLLMVLVNLEVWCRLFLDGISAVDVSESLESHRKAA